jgi:hypothetical protein
MTHQRPIPLLREVLLDALAADTLDVLHILAVLDILIIMDGDIRVVMLLQVGVSMVTDGVHHLVLDLLLKTMPMKKKKSTKLKKLKKKSRS